jgi:hypothetical protein
MGLLLNLPSIANNALKFISSTVKIRSTKRKKTKKKKVKSKKYRRKKKKR